MLVRMSTAARPRMSQTLPKLFKLGWPRMLLDDRRNRSLPRMLPQETWALSLISGTGVGDRPAVPIPALDYTSGSSEHHVIAPACIKRGGALLSRSLGSGFVDRMDASQVIHPTFGRMLLSNGMALGWCDRRNYPPRLPRALPNPHDVRATREQEKEYGHEGEEAPLSIEELHDI